MAAWLGRVTETEHIAGNQPVTRGQWRPQVMPVPAGGRKAVDQQQRLGSGVARRPVANGLAVKAEVATLSAPGVQGDAWQRTHAA